MNFTRFENNFNYFARIGQDDDLSITRLAFSPEYFEVIREMEKYCQNIGLRTRIDKIGNLFFSYNPNKSDKFLMVGSHMDTVRSAGMYDGALGVIGALEVIESVKEDEIDLDYGIIGAAFNGEEGSKLGGTFGSRTITNRSNYDDPTLAEKLEDYSLSIDDLRESVIDFTKVIGFLELHIEQGGILDKEDIDIGIVDTIVGLARYNIIIKGEANHGGTTPMNLRKDPVKRASLVLEKLYDLAKAYSDPFVMTVGNIQISPGSYNVIPSQLTIYLEIRDKDQDNLDSFIKNLQAYIASEINDCIIEEVIKKAPVSLDKDLIKTLSTISSTLGYETKIMASGADHDAKEISHLVPTSLIFVPSIGGVSHSKEEYTREDQIEKGLNLLYQSVVKLIGRK